MSKRPRSSTSSPEQNVHIQYSDRIVTPDEPHRSKRQRTVRRELPQMMYGYGDSAEPVQESVDLVRDLVENYILKMTEKAQKLAHIRGKFNFNCFVFLLRRDSVKLARVQELLWLDSEIKKARMAKLEEIKAAAARKSNV